MRIKGYTEYITEVRRITSHQSSSGRSREVDVIYDEPITNYAPSAGVALRDKLRSEEFADMVSQLPPNTPKYLTNRFIKYSKKNIDKFDKFKITMNNLQYVKDMAKEGDLYCEYCKKGPLIIYDINPTEHDMKNIGKNHRFNTKFNPSDGATCDHREPLSRGGHPFDYSNLAVCCARCNRRKGSMSYDHWMSINTQVV